MSNSPTDLHLDRFLRAVHRRWVVVRVAEATGVGVAAACGLALPMLPILMWRGEPALPVVLTAAALAALAGTIAGIVRRPTLASAAVEADRQLGLADLLSTALAMRDRAAGDPWSAVVVASAAARCRTLAPSSVIVNRFHGRAWGGIGLATALVLTLALMSADPNQSAAVTGAADDKPNVPLAALPRSRHASDGQTSAAQAARRTSVDGADGANERERATGGTAGPADDHASRATSSGEGGGAAGLATSPRTHRAQRPPQANIAGSRNQTVGDPSAGGASASRAPADEKDEPSSLSSAPLIHSDRAPPWRESTWPTAREEALSAVRDGTVRGAYRDLVRAYFDRSPE